MMIDYQVQLTTFPDMKTKEAVSENNDGSYTIFIENSLQQKAFMHAMKHILGNDFEKIDVDKIEADAHSI